MGGAAPPLQLETRTLTQPTTPTPPQVREETVIMTDLPVDIKHQTTEEPTITTVIPQVDFEEIVQTVSTERPVKIVATVSPITTTTQITIATPTAKPLPPAPRLSGKEREALIAHLNDVDLSTIEKLVLSPRQKLALTQELEYKRLGLAAFSDPTPWQRLTREEQSQFNEKYLALRPDLQEYSKVQFTSLPEERQEHAYRMFLHLDIDTLSQVINRELERQLEAQNLFENESLINEFEEVTLSDNQHHHQQELSQNIPEKESIFEQTSILAPQGQIHQFDNSQNLFEQQKTDVSSIEEQRRQFQISEQQLQQLQQQLEQLDEPGQQSLQSSQILQESHTKITEQFEVPHMLQLSSQHIQQIQHAIQLLKEPGIVGRSKDLFEQVNEETKEYEQSLDLPKESPEKIQENPILVMNNSTQRQQRYSFDFDDTATESPLKLESTSNDKTHDQQPVEQSGHQPTQQPTHEHAQQAETVREPLQQQSLNELAHKTIILRVLQPQYNNSSEGFLETDEQADLVIEPNQQTQTTQLQGVEKQTELVLQEAQKSKSLEAQTTDIEYQPLQGQGLLQFEEITETPITPEQQDQQSPKILRQPLQQDSLVIGQEQGQLNIPEHQTEKVTQSLQSADLFENLKNQAENLTLPASQPMNIGGEDRIKSPKSIFFGQNKQIEELRKEFKLTAKKFSENWVQNKIKLKNKAELPKFQGTEEPIVHLQKWPLFPEVVTIKPQFLQIVTELEAKMKQLQSETRPFFPNRLKQKTEQSGETIPPHVRTTQQLKNPTQVFRQEPTLELEPFSYPIRQLQKISEDLKLRASQPSRRSKSRPFFDPRIRQQQESRKRLQLQEQPQEPTPAELKHFQEAEAQIAKAIRLQECINNPSSCHV